MAQLSSSTSQYRDGVFSASSPAPKYGTMTRPFENGSLGDDMTLESDAAAMLDPALDHLVASLQPGGLESRALPPPALAAAACAVALAQQARAESEINRKLVVALAATYSAGFFGLPRNTVPYTIDQIFGMYGMSTLQRRQYHQEAAALLDQYVATLTKGNSMSGVFRDGVLGNAMFQNGAIRDGSLGRQNGAFHDGSLGMFQNTAFHDGSLGALQKTRRRLALQYLQNAHRRRTVAPSTPGMSWANLKGLGGGCGCSGMGATVAPEPLVTDEGTSTIPGVRRNQALLAGGVAVALGLVWYVATKKK